jgi:hypothetical protein
VIKSASANRGHGGMAFVPQFKTWLRSRWNQGDIHMDLDRERSYRGMQEESRHIDDLMLEEFVDAK